jgi:hypothetical protein
MAKLAFFLEGDCEKCLIQFCLQNCFSHIRHTLDVWEFDNYNENDHYALLYDCTGYQNVLPKATHYKPILWDANLILIRDLEKTPCNTGLSTEILNAIPELSSQKIKFGLFSRPCIEAIYHCDITLFMKVMKQMYRETFGSQSEIPSSFQNDLLSINWNDPLISLKNFCRKFNMALNKKKIAEKFFSQLDYSSNNHPYIERLKSILSCLDN